MSTPAIPGRLTASDPQLSERQRHVLARLVALHRRDARPVSSERLGRAALAVALRRRAPVAGGLAPAGVVLAPAGPGARRLARGRSARVARARAARRAPRVARARPFRPSLAHARARARYAAGSPGVAGGGERPVRAPARRHARVR